MAQEQGNPTQNKSLIGGSFMVNILINRWHFSPKATIGTLSIPSLFKAYSLEDVDRGLSADMSLTDLLAQKVQNQTAIPHGTYQIVMDFSMRFQRIMPHILNVPAFTGIRIHGGNTNLDTDGCPMLGTFFDTNKDIIWGCAEPVSKFNEILTKLLADGEYVQVTISKGTYEMAVPV
jgi:hypothetical protein